MKKLQGKQVSRLAMLFAMTYMVSYITRINYGAIIEELIETTGHSEALLSLAVTGSFITYGAGQIVSGIIGDRFQPKKLVALGLGVSVLMNLLIPICQNPYQMAAVWCVNGFAQSFLWPPMVRILTVLLNSDDYKRSSAKISWGSSIGTIVVYLMAPLLITTLGWKSVFFVSAAFGVLMIFIWNRFSYEIPRKQAVSPAVAKEKKGHHIAVLFAPLMLLVMLAIILQGMLRDGVTTWMPTFISDTYDLGSSISILTGVVLPLFGILCFQIGSRLYMKVFTNPMICAGVFFGAGALAAGGLYLFNGVNPILSVVLSAALTGCMHGVNLILICMIPPFFAKYGIISTASGVLNSCTYIGSALSTYGVAVLSNQLGWN
ncbi:MAG: MFS transporter, partial [Clostridia bacterium]|nr:MFS transporter [Clostridia bacterium]